MTKNLPLSNELAHRFADILAEWLTPKEQTKIIQLNGPELTMDSNICHTHDFCDSNQAMINALASLGIALDVQDDVQNALVSRAWTIAKNNHFWFALGLVVKVLRGVGPAFFTWLDERYFDVKLGTWWPGRDYGRCTLVNAAPILWLEEQGLICRMMGIDEKIAGKHAHKDLVGGHDWLLIGGRYILDLWGHSYLQFPVVIFDLADERDARLIASAFGPRKYWKAMSRENQMFWTEPGNEDWREFINEGRTNNGKKA